MAGSASRPAELTLPTAALTELRDTLTAQVGARGAADALRAAGYAAGTQLHRILAGSHEDELAALPAEQFWARLALLFSSRGWGQLAYSEAHPGVGSLEATDWGEANDARAERPSCHLTTGLLANLLGQVAGAEIAVLETECRTAGHQRCRFLFGGTAALHAVYDRLSAGETADAALAQIG
jgi:predicted hydrocarbon binding protein